MTHYKGRHRAPGGNAARRFAALGLLGSSTVAAVMFIAPSPVSAKAPDVVAWWSSANVGDPEPAPPVPPDVKDGDLLVQGSNPGAVPDPLGAAPATSQAVAGLAFQLPTAALVSGMTLQVDGSPPPQISVVACQATEPFTSADNGPWSEVPSYDGNACVPGKLKGSAVGFADVGKLVSRDELALVILPGPVDRVVFKPPNDKTLDVSGSGGVGAAAPPVGAGTGSTTTTGGKGSSTTAPVGGSAVAAPPTVNLPDNSGTTTTTPGADTPPVVAGSQGATTPLASKPAAQTSSSGLSTRNRRIIAFLVIAAEVVGYALLMRNRVPSGAAPVATGVVAGGKLRAPDRWAGLRGAGAAGTAGVGRFRRERVGMAPHL